MSCEVTSDLALSGVTLYFDDGSRLTRSRKIGDDVMFCTWASRYTSSDCATQHTRHRLKSCCQHLSCRGRSMHIPIYHYRLSLNCHLLVAEPFQLPVLVSGSLCPAWQCRLNVIRRLVLASADNFSVPAICIISVLSSVDPYTIFDYSGQCRKVTTWLTDWLTLKDRQRSIEGL